MAITNLMELSLFLRPSSAHKTMYALPVVEKEDMSYADCIRSVNLLETLKRLDLLWDVTYKGKRTRENDNELYYKITIWEPIREFT